MQQLPLFPPSDNRHSRTTQLDGESETLLGAFRSLRLASGVSLHSVAREVSQLRSLARESGMISLTQLFTDMSTVARVLREPRSPISHSTSRARLLAAQQFIKVMGRNLRWDPAAMLTTLDALLPSRPSTGWHTAGTLLAGSRGRRRRRGPSLTVSDLKRLVDAAAETSPDRASRDRALVALHCFTGLRPEEIVTLRWESLVNEVTPTGTYMLLVCVERAGRSLRLPVLEPAAEAVRLFAWYLNASIDSLSGPVFSARRWPEETLAYRTARDILAAACRRAGLPRVEAVELRSALANWLHSRGLSEHEVRDTLGINRVRSVDRLLERHTALEAQRRVREILDR